MTLHRIPDDDERFLTNRLARNAEIGVSRKNAHRSARTGQSARSRSCACLEASARAGGGLFLLVGLLFFVFAVLGSSLFGNLGSPRLLRPP
jgi:hypothetical protein